MKSRRTSASPTRVTIGAAVTLALALLAAPAAAVQVETCTTDVAADLVPGGIDAEVGDWIVTHVDVWTETVDACEGVTVAAYLKDADGETLAWGSDVFSEGEASVEMTEGLAPVGPIVEVVIELPVDPPTGDVPTPIAEVPGDDGPAVLDEAAVHEAVTIAAASTGEATSVLGSGGPIARTGASSLMLVLLGAAGLVLGLWLLRFRDLVR